MLYLVTSLNLSYEENYILVYNTTKANRVGHLETHLLKKTKKRHLVYNALQTNQQLMQMQSSEQLTTFVYKRKRSIMDSLSLLAHRP